jgi:hypothetical protein
MTTNSGRSNKRNLFIVGTAAALVLAPQAIAAEGSDGASEVKALRDENAQLRNQLAEMQKKLDQTAARGRSTQSAKRSGRQDPYALKAVGPDSAGKASAEMTCGANMNMNGPAAGKTAGEMTCGSRRMGPMPKGSQFYYNPVIGGSDDMFHVHPEGMWMFNTRWMHSEKNGLQDGHTAVSPGMVGPAVLPGSPYPTSRYPYMMIPTRMTMDMFMFMGMYGVTDRFTVMGMVNYQSMNSPMLMDMGNMPTMNMSDMGGMGGMSGMNGMGGMGGMNMPPPHYHLVSAVAPMVTAGLGDTQLYGIYKIYADPQLGVVTGTVGLNLPTGSTVQTIDMMGVRYRAPYDMQLGSGTVDFKPALTYNWVSQDALWNLGAQASGTIHSGTSHGWAYGNSFKLSAWAQRAFGPMTTWVRTTYTDTAHIRGQDVLISCLNIACDPAKPMQVAITPDANPLNYGGQVWNALAGVAYQYNNFSLGVEAGLPVYQNLYGLQMRNSWQLTTGVQAMF